MMDKTVAKEIREAKQKEREKKRTTKVTYCSITKEWVAKHVTNRNERIDLLQLGLQLLGTLEIVCTKVSK
jgi:hemerythrin